jgi:hypothetical protein
MSVTTMYLFEAPTWEAKHHAEFGNSWGWAAFVWDSLLGQYFKEIPGVEMRGGWPASSLANWKKLWDPQIKIPMEPWERVVLRATYDRAIIHVGQFAQVAACLRKFERVHFCPALDGVSHLGDIAFALEELLKVNQGLPRGMAVGFQATSVAQNLWQFYDEETGDSQPYSLEKHKLHHVVELAS